MRNSPRLGKREWAGCYDTHNEQTASEGANMSNERTQHLETIGHACGTLQASYGSVRRALEEVGARPVLVVNGLAHFDEADVERAAERLAQQQAGKR